MKHVLAVVADVRVHVFLTAEDAESYDLQCGHLAKGSIPRRLLWLVGEVLTVGGKALAVNQACERRLRREDSLARCLRADFRRF